MKLDYQLIFGIDKQMHFLSYASISIILAIVIIIISDRQSVKRNLSIIWFVLVVIGIVEEYRQYITPNRSAELLDAFANILGVTFGLVTPLLFYYTIKSRRHVEVKLLITYSVVILPLLIGLVYLNERPFIACNESFQEKIRSLVAIIGL